MGVQYILKQVGNKMGLNPAVADQRSVMLRFVNEAVRELYEQSDMVGSLTEQCFKVNGDQTIALPSYVGKLRAVREVNSQIPWSINQMRPRYNVSNWPDMWRNFRLKNLQTLERAITNEGPVTIVCDAIESTPAVVTIAGSTLAAERIVETVTMDETEKTTTNAFTNITLFRKNVQTSCNYGMLDMDRNVLSVIANNRLQATYQIVDISQLPWLNQNQGPQDHFVEILYKEVLPYLQDDGDEFPAIGFDDVIVNKCLQLWCEEEGKGEEAALYDAKATRTLARIQEDQNRSTQDCVALVANPHDSLLLKVRHGDRWRYRGYIGGIQSYY